MAAADDRGRLSDAEREAEREELQAEWERGDPVELAQKGARAHVHALDLRSYSTKRSWMP